MNKKVMAAAIKLENGDVRFLPRPSRHFHIIHKLASEGHEQKAGDIQGFLLNDGTFVDRREAALIAMANHQVSALSWPPNLYSEDLW